MKIGIDFDNTLISYDSIFFKTALKKGLINENLPQTKVAVRDYLRNLEKDHLFTQLQAEIYGPLIKKAEIFEGASKTLNTLSKKNILYIISHKTKYPYSGPKYDLRFYADTWLKKHNLHPNCEESPISGIFYEEDINNKINRITNLNCDFFIDDLPSILNLLPNSIHRILFNPNKYELKNDKFLDFNNWFQAAELIDSLN